MVYGALWRQDSGHFRVGKQTFQPRVVKNSHCHNGWRSELCGWCPPLAVVLCLDIQKYCLIFALQANIMPISALGGLVRN